MVKAQKDRMVRDMAIMQTAQAYYANNSDKKGYMAEFIESVRALLVEKDRMHANTQFRLHTCLT